LGKDYQVDLRGHDQPRGWRTRELAETSFPETACFLST
jgi:hypothetical protein